MIQINPRTGGRRVGRGHATLRRLTGDGVAPEGQGMAEKKPIIGQRYRDLDVTSWNAEWIIDAIFKGTDGRDYADLRSVSDRTLHKTLSLSVMADLTRFAPAGPAEPPAP
jgi:hypothetical protein